MSTTVRMILSVMSILFFLTVGGQDVNAQVNDPIGDDDHIHGQVLIAFEKREGMSLDELISDVNSVHGTETIKTFETNDAMIYLLRSPLSSSVSEMIALLQLYEPVWQPLFIEPNYVNDVPMANPREFWFFGGYDPTPQTIQYAREMINLDVAHTICTGEGQIVAVLDTGVQLDHPELVDHWVEGYDFLDNDSDPTDVPAGIDRDGDEIMDEAWGHGTHVAGIVRQVAPDAQIMPLRVLNSEGAGDVVAIVEAIQFAADNGANVINMSFGTPNDSQFLRAIVNDVIADGVVVVAAAGNGGTDVAQYPAAIPDVIAVTSIDAEGNKAPFANYGAWVDVAAPGESIFSTFPDTAYAYWSGTSMAAPFVAGEAALLAGMGATDAVQVIWDSAVPLTAEQLGAGQIDVASALSLSTNQPLSVSVREISAGSSLITLLTVTLLMLLTLLGVTQNRVRVTLRMSKKGCVTDWLTGCLNLQFHLFVLITSVCRTLRRFTMRLSYCTFFNLRKVEGNPILAKNCSQPICYAPSKKERFDSRLVNIHKDLS